MHSNLASNAPAVFAIQSRNGFVHFEPGKLYWQPVTDASEGEDFLNALDGAVTPPRGRLFSRGKDLARMSRRDLLCHLAHTAFLTPSGDLISNLSVMENLLVTTSPGGELNTGDLVQKLGEETTGKLFENTKTREPFLLSLPYQLSPLDRARAGILRALLRMPPWVVRTEEPPGLDPAARKEYLRLLSYLRSRIPHAPWLFVCVPSELPESWTDFETLECLWS